jgi:prolyl oligopeptidase
MWKRGTPLESATLVAECPTDFVGISGYSVHTPEGRYDMVRSIPAFFRGTHSIVRDDKLVQLELPDDVDMQGIFKEHLLISLRTDWTIGGRTYPQDALLAIGLDDFLGGKREFATLFEPKARVALSSVSSTRNHLLVTTLDNVRSRIYQYTLDGGKWKSSEIKLPGLGSAGITGASDDDDVFYITYTDFLTPSSLYIVRDGKKLEKIKSTPAQFDATGMKVVQYEATSKDGTRIPYFVFTPKGFKANTPYPTLLYGYGGFEISMRPSYSGSVGSAWVGRGGVYALANIRGGGEFGPK